MNTNINSGRGLAVVLVSLFLGLAATVRSIGAVDGLKGAPLLQQRNAISSEVSPPAAAKPGQSMMSCTRCVDQVVTQVNPQMKGGQLLNQGGRATEQTVRHDCPGCQTTGKTVGYGKGARTVAQHTCKDCGQHSSACCATSTGHGATH